MNSSIPSNHPVLGNTKKQVEVAAFIRRESARIAAQAKGNRIEALRLGISAAKTKGFLADTDANTVMRLAKVILTATQNNSDLKKALSKARHNGRRGGPAGPRRCAAQGTS